MPIFFQQDIDKSTKLGVWKIEEGEDFFRSSVLPQRNVSHPHKKLQHLAGRYLLKYLFPDFPVELILVADTRKPYLQDEAYHFSISHCGDYAAAIVSKERRVGVDIELVTHKVGRIQHKFVSGEEEGVNNHWSIKNEASLDGFQQLTLLWSCKEAVFKWFGNGEVDFKRHIKAQKQRRITEGTYQTFICFDKDEGQQLCLHSHFFEVEGRQKGPQSPAALVLSYVFT